MSLKGKKVAVLAEEMYQEMELWVPYYRLKEEGADVKVVGPEKKTYKSKNGYPVNAAVAAICHAGWVPISAGILKGKTATCFFAIKDDMINAGAKYVDQEVVVDGNLITSRKPDDLPAFCRELVKALEK
jgi:protease I